MCSRSNQLSPQQVVDIASTKTPQRSTSITQGQETQVSIMNWMHVIAIVELCYFYVHLHVVVTLAWSDLQGRLHVLKLCSTVAAWDVQVSRQSGYLQEFCIVKNAQIVSSMLSVSRLEGDSVGLQC